MILTEILASLGLQEDVVGIYNAPSRNPNVHGYAYMTSDLLGGNIHYPDVGDRISVAFTWTNTQKLTEEHFKKKRYAHRL